MAVLEQIRPGLKDRAAGETIVRDVRVEYQENSFGEEALFLILILSDPPAGQVSWPVDDIEELRGSLRDHVAVRLPDLSVPWYVEFELEHPELEDDGAPGEQLNFFDR